MPKLSSQNLTPTHPKKTNRLCLVQSIFDLCSQGKLKEAINSLQLLAQRGIRLDSNTLAFLLEQCGSHRSLYYGKWVHLHLKLTGLKHPKTFLSNQLISMYFKCGDYKEAQKVFDKMPVRNVFSWNAILAGYAKSGMINYARRVFDRMPERDVVSWNTMVIGLAQSGFCEEAVGLYRRFRRLGIGYNEFSFAGILTACVRLKELGLSRQVHGQVLVVGFMSNLILSSSLVDAYAKCGWIDNAHKLFDEMPMKDVLSWTTLVSGYAKCGDIEIAHRLFDEMPLKNAVSWTALIGGYAWKGQGPRALELFTKMVKEGVKPDQFTFSSCLFACTSIASLKHGKQIHAHLIRTRFNPNTIVVSTLIDMYSKCGSLEASRRVFDCLGKNQDVVSWNTMIAALAQHGRGVEAIQLFEEMVRVGVNPNDITFVVIFTACSHSGLVNEGVGIFDSMSWNHGVVPGQEHYACLVDLLGRSGRFNEVIDLLEKMPCEPDGRVWYALLGACRIHGNLELGTKAAERLIELEPQSPSAYVVLSNIYAADGRWDDVAKVRHMMNKRQVRKEPAISWVEVKSKVHVFSVSDQVHPSKDEIYAALQQFMAQMENDANIV
ncbi:pentatricopeptide repeat (PPR-like) superfamily protein [Tasmannia lanceolata]|uniref:pentatricopeptide repeat (PPR-like) superfamily protein n=1 Tax=Tasmannia lanceolata TaxID=3420 RepID=UPI0040646C62